jgi:4-hydroxybenzoate polyprenyltransferase
MIQRIQSVWLLLAGIAGVLAIRLPLWKATLQDKTVKIFSGPESLLLFAVMIIATLLAFVTIFLYKNRKLQMRLCIFGILLSIATILLEFFKVGNFRQPLNIFESSWQIGALLPILMIVFFMFAYSNIRKDEKLVKSLDRLR